MRKHASTMILILILVVGLSLMLYPSFSNWWNEAHQSRAIAAYSQEVSKLDENRYDELWQQAWEYNRSLVGRENAYLLDDSQKAEYERLLDVSGMGIMGYIEIPSLKVSLPIYHGTEESVLWGIWSGRACPWAGRAPTASCPVTGACPVLSSLPTWIGWWWGIGSGWVCWIRC